MTGTELHPDDTPSARAIRLGCGALVGIATAWGSGTWLLVGPSRLRVACMALFAVIGAWLGLRGGHAFFVKWARQRWLE